MKTTRKVISEEISDVFCNKCGMSCKGHVGNFNGLIEATVTGGYDSTHLEDGDVYTFSLCERCVKELIDSFTLWSKKGNYLFPEEDNPPDFNRREFFGEGITFWADLSEEERAVWRKRMEETSVLNTLNEVPYNELVVWLYEIENKDDPRANDAETINAIRTELKRRKDG